MAITVSEVFTGFIFTYNQDAGSANSGNVFSGLLRLYSPVAGGVL